MSRDRSPMDKDEKIQRLEDRIDELDATMRKMLPSRRDALKLGGAAALGAAAMSGNVSAGSSQVGTIGTTSDRVDVNAEDIDVSDTITTDNIEATTTESDNIKSLSYTVGANSDRQLDPNDPTPVAIFILGAKGNPGRSGIFIVTANQGVFDIGSARSIGTSSGADQVNIFDDNGTVVIENTLSFAIDFDILKID